MDRTERFGRGRISYFAYKGEVSSYVLLGLLPVCHRLLMSVFKYLRTFTYVTCDPISDLCACMISRRICSDVGICQEKHCFEKWTMNSDGEQDLGNNEQTKQSLLRARRCEQRGFV